MCTDVHHADRIVERVVVDDQPRMAGALEHADQLAELDVLLHVDDVGARNHDVADAALAQTEDVLEHPALFRREAGFAGRHGIEDVLEVGADRVRSPAEHRAQHAGEPAAAFRARRDRHRQTPRVERRVGRGAGTVAVGHGGQATSVASATE
jgi:hypothetical protein